MQSRSNTREGRLAGACEPARQLAAELERLFAGDAEIAKRLNDAHGRLTAANERLWSGLHPDGLSAVYGSHPQFETLKLEAALNSRSDVLESADALGQLQDVHWQIHRAHADYQEAAEDRRQLAAEIGEVIRAFVDELVDAGWSEDEARNANVRELTAGGSGDG
jgi:hypothetical protein